VNIGPGGDGGKGGKGGGAEAQSCCPKGAYAYGGLGGTGGIGGPGCDGGKGGSGGDSGDADATATAGDGTNALARAHAIRKGKPNKGGPCPKKQKKCKPGKKGDRGKFGSADARNTCSPGAVDIKPKKK
jgi:hypothetical protein